jgi:hypothetical protein
VPRRLTLPKPLTLNAEWLFLSHQRFAAFTFNTSVGVRRLNISLPSTQLVSFTGCIRIGVWVDRVELRDAKGGAVREVGKRIQQVARVQMYPYSVNG